MSDAITKMEIIGICPVATGHGYVNPSFHSVVVQRVQSVVGMKEEFWVLNFNLPKSTMPLAVGYKGHT